MNNINFGRKDTRIRNTLISAITIMDDKGRLNPEGNSYMLWEEDWDKLRLLLLKCVEDNED